MTIDTARIARVLDAATGRAVLLETEGLDLLAALGIDAPAHLFVRDAAEARAADTSLLGGDRVVVKVISPRILHKSDVGGVKIVERKAKAIAAAVADMEKRLGGQEIVGFTINEFLRYDTSIGNELILGLRWTEDFGPVVTLGAGGIYTEFLAENFKPGREIGIFSPSATTDREIEEAIDRLAVGRLATGRLRGQEPRIAKAPLIAAVRRFMALASAFAPQAIAECEINPLVVAGGRLVALDVLVKLGSGPKPARPPRPLAKLAHLLEPKSAAIIGVSEKMNPGHIILKNLIREGFDREQIFVIKPGAALLEGCRCIPNIGTLPQKVDLFILAVSAAQTPQAITEIVEGRKAESIIVIPGGLEEKEGTEAIVGRMHAALAEARASEWQGPIINGGNCLGIRSLPGRYDTMFIPEHKMPAPTGEMSPVAFISQSGAFAVSRMSKLGRLNPKYAITLGNQMDLTVGDYLTRLKDDPGIEVFAVYVEGFTRLDGLRFVEAAREIVASGRTVVLYRAGRTAAGAKASASHTASIAGDYAVARELARAAGVVVAESLWDFDDLVCMFTFLRDKRVAGPRLGAVSNAGFECVAVADALGDLKLATFDGPTLERLKQVFAKARIDMVVDVHNPIDLTPMACDGAYEDSLRAVLKSDGVDLGLVSCVPLSGALNTLPAGPGHREDVTREDSIAMGLARVHAESDKAFVAVVDAGTLYDPFVAVLERHGIPAFRAADRAMRLLNVFVASRRRAAAADR